MSFILDALRKSEHERQRQSGPGIADLQPVSVPHRLPIWAITLGVLLVINIIAVLALVWRGESSPAANSAPTAAQAPAPMAAAPANQPVATPPAPAPATLQPAESVPPAVSAASGAQAANPGNTSTAPEPGSAAESRYALPPPVLPGATQRDPQLAARDTPPPEPEFNEENLPSLNDVQMQGRRVPELHLDIHVYSGAPAERFVFLNMRKYREGQTTPDGTRIERITRDGVVLNHHGLRFILPRQ